MFILSLLYYNIFLRTKITLSSTPERASKWKMTMWKDVPFPSGCTSQWSRDDVIQPSPT